MRLGRAPRRRGGHRRWRQARRRWERLHVTHYRATRRPMCHYALHGCTDPRTTVLCGCALWRRAAPLLESRARCLSTYDKLGLRREWKYILCIVRVVTTQSASRARGPHLVTSVWNRE